MFACWNSLNLFSIFEGFHTNNAVSYIKGLWLIIIFKIFNTINKLHGIFHLCLLKFSLDILSNLSISFIFLHVRIHSVLFFIKLLLKPANIIYSYLICVPIGISQINIPINTSRISSTTVLTTSCYTYKHEHNKNYDCNRREHISHPWCIWNIFFYHKFKWVWPHLSVVPNINIY